MEMTKYKHLPESDQNQGLPQPPLEKVWEGQGMVVDLPDPATFGARQIDLTAAINQRRSVRSYSSEPISLAELSYLLWCTQGVKEITARPATLRTVPSAGSRHPFETYVLANRVEGLEPGIYVYLASRNQLRRHLAGPGLADKVAHAAFRQKFVATSAVTLIWSAFAYRSIWRYGQRAYRYMHLDAGHVCAHLYLAVEAIGCGCCAIAAFDDDELNGILGLDGREEFAIYLGTVGKPAKR
jgi:SagB-type dehydrogenase family enzyme